MRRREVDDTVKKEITEYEMDMNRVVKFLQKQPSEFTKEDIIRFIHGNNIEVVNFCYPGADGRMKKLNFPVKNLKYVDLILETGERVDGSSLFPYIDPSNSDVYVVPRYRTAFVDPFSAHPALNFMCAYCDRTGEALNIGPFNVVERVHRRIKGDTGITVKALGEVEYYAIMTVDRDLYPAIPQKNYHEAAPFVKGEPIREAILIALSRCGIDVKYAHSEVGEVPSTGDQIAEQHEIELLPAPLEDMADYLTISKWIIRNVAAQCGVLVTFAPKIQVGHAGSGLHIHLCAERDGKGIMTGKKGELSVHAKQMIGGLLKYARSITAFGNMIPTSFLRLVPNQEAPTKICWAERNRSALIRVPLGWGHEASHMGQLLNYGEKRANFELPERQTFEIRSPDLSAHPYHLLSALGAAIHWGLTHPDEALEVADDLYVTGNIFRDKKKGERFADLPASCAEAAKALQQERDLYEGVGFPSELIDGVMKRLNAYGDEHLRQEIEKDPHKMESLVEEYIHCG